MITAQECRDIQGYNDRNNRINIFSIRINKLNELIKERVNEKYKFRSLPLNGTGFGRLTNSEKKYLQAKGYQVWEGHGGKCGTFDIIGW